MKLGKLWSERHACITKSAWNSSLNPSEATPWHSYLYLVAVPVAILLGFCDLYDSGVLFCGTDLESLRDNLYQGRAFCTAGVFLQSLFIIRTSFWQWEAFVLDKTDSSCEALQSKSPSKSDQIDCLLLYRIVYAGKHLLCIAPWWIGLGFLFGDTPMALCDLMICATGTAIFSAITLFLKEAEETERCTCTLNISAVLCVACIVALWVFQMVYGEIYYRVISEDFAKICWPLAFDFSNYGTALSFVLLFAWIRSRAIQISA